MMALDAPPGEGMYEWAEDWRTAGEVASFAGEWRVDEDLSVGVAHAALPGSEIMTALGRGNPATARDPFIMSRVHTEDAAWGTAAWWGSADTPEIALLRGARGGEELSLDGAFGIDVTVGDRRVMLLTSAAGGAEFGDVTLDGSAALVEFAGGQPVRCVVAEGSSVDVG
jgi:hypothetical protein